MAAVRGHGEQAPPFSPDCQPAGLDPADAQRCRVARQQEGRRLFEDETFGGNGRTCLTWQRDPYRGVLLDPRCTTNAIVQPVVPGRAGRPDPPAAGVARPPGRGCPFAANGRLCHSGPMLNRANEFSTPLFGNPKGAGMFSVGVSEANFAENPIVTLLVHDGLGPPVPITTPDIGVLMSPHPFAPPIG